MATESQIDPTVIVDNEPVDKADLRNQLAIAASEITALMQITSLPRRLAYSDTEFDSL